MELQEALRIVRSLASGVNPESNQPLDENSLYRKPDIIKALNRALAALVQLERREREKPANAGRYWSKEEDVKVCDEVRQGLDFRQIAKEHNRSVGSIVARLVKLGQIAPQRSPAKAA
jgi:DNA-binding NarL/FixJ family response regulator